MRIVGGRCAVLVCLLLSACESVEHPQSGSEAGLMGDVDGGSGSTEDAALDTNSAPLDDGQASTEDGGAPADASIDAGQPTVDASPGPGDATTTGDADTTADASPDAAAVPDGGDGWGGTLPCGKLGDQGATSRVLFDVGHAGRLAELQPAGDRLLSTGIDGTWVLWNTNDHALLARGDSAPPEFSGTPTALLPKVGGNRFVVVTADLPPPLEFGVRNAALRLHSMTTGALEATVALGDPQQLPAFGIASDGSYVWAASGAGIRIWDAQGSLLASANGNYANARVSAAPGILRVASGSAGAQVIESISTSTGLSALSPAFAGNFHSWFLDGEHFFTNVGTTLRIYTKDAVSRGIAALTRLDGLTGRGSVFWTAWTTLDIYSLADPATLVKSYAIGFSDSVHSARDLIAVTHHGEPALDLVSLAEPGFPKTTVALPVPYPEAFAATPSGSKWWFGDHSGGLFDGSDFAHPLSCGAVYSVAGSDTGTVAIATSAGGVQVFDLSAEPRRYLGNIPINSSHVEISADGRVLAVEASLRDAQYGADRSFRVISLPAASTSRLWPYTWSEYPTLFFGFSMSSAGNRVALLTGTFTPSSLWSWTQRVFEVAQSEPVFTLTGGSEVPFVLSPDGTRIAASSASEGPAVTNIYENGQLVGAADGSAVAWVAADRLLVRRSALRSEIYDSKGVLQSAPSLPAFHDVQVLPANELYSEAHHAIFSLSTGAKTWSGTGTVTAGAVTGPHVVYTSWEQSYLVVRATR